MMNSVYCVFMTAHAYAWKAILHIARVFIFFRTAIHVDGRPKFEIPFPETWSPKTAYFVSFHDNVATYVRISSERNKL